MTWIAEHCSVGNVLEWEAWSGPKPLAEAITIARGRLATLAQRAPSERNPVIIYRVRNYETQQVIVVGSA